MSLIDQNGVLYVQGTRRRYPIDSLTWDDNIIGRIDVHLIKLWTLDTRHPDIDPLLEARWEAMQ